eukprot:gene8789-9728_t
MPPKRKAAVKAEPSASDVDFSKMKVVDLKAECAKLGLDASGRKQDLIDRLQQNQTKVQGKKVKVEEPEEKEDVKLTMKEQLMALAKEEKKNKPKQQSQREMLSYGNGYYVWTRWGRVGESGRNDLKGPLEFGAAEKEFEKKFKDKTRNNWKDRENFEAMKGKYTLLEIDTSDEVDAGDIERKLNATDQTDGPKKKIRPCKLDKPTQGLLSLIFSTDMFKDAMKQMSLDVKKMPLGKLSKTQIAKGFEALEEIKEILENGAVGGKITNSLADQTSKFYTVIPHDFGRQRPPVINTTDVLQQKMDMLTVLGDIEIAQGLKREEESSQADLEEVDHPLDIDYGLLDTTLELVDKKSEEFKVIKEYTEKTGSKYGSQKILEVWKVNRHSEGTRFATHDDIENRKLLWHGTNVAVVAAIMKGGLRIMPHSGGRVGRGLYFASENSKSSCYVRSAADGTGIMFLNEVALGKEHKVLRDDHTLKSAPKGFDSVLAKGQTEPDPKKDIKMEFDGKQVVVPQGEPQNQSGSSSSSFFQSEYLVYKESQVRIRYLLKMKF